MTDSVIYPKHYSLMASDLFNAFCQTTSFAGAKVKRGVDIAYDNGSVAAEKTKVFIKNNWQKLLGFIGAWAVIVVGTGLMYGFSAVSLPLTIGLTCGFFFGILTGVILCKTDTAKTKDDTIWSKLNKRLNELDANGTRAIVISVAVTVLLAAAVVFPIATGATFGIVLGNHLSTTIALDENLGSKETLDDKVDKIVGKQKALQKDFEEVKILIESAQKAFEKIKAKLYGQVKPTSDEIQHLSRKSKKTSEKLDEYMNRYLQLKGELDKIDKELAQLQVSSDNVYKTDNNQSTMSNDLE